VLRVVAGTARPPPPWLTGAAPAAAIAAPAAAIAAADPPGGAAAEPSATAACSARMRSCQFCKTVLRGVGRGVSVASTAKRQTGHVLCERSHCSRQFSWKRWPHGILVHCGECVAISSEAFSSAASDARSVKQTEHCPCPSAGAASRTSRSMAPSLAGGGPASPG